MKRAFTLIILIMLVLAGFSQSFSYSKSGGGYKPDPSSPVIETLTVDGKDFDVRASTGGSKYVIQESSRGSDYAFWIGEDTGQKFDGHPVRKYKSGTYVALLVKNGKLSKRYLEPDSNS